jgi:hypothetical protein
MASNIDISGLTMNPLEVDSISEFVVERTFNDPTLQAIHTVWTGVQMKEQIVFASQLGLTGVLDSTCTRPNSGAQSVQTQKYWEPANIGDTLVHCQTDVNSLYKAYYTKITKYADLFDISGSDLEKFLMVLLDEAVMRSIWRVAWYGDTAVAASQVAAAGLIAAGNVQFFDQIDGFWKQIFAAVTAGDVTNATNPLTALNALTVKANQIALTAGDSVLTFESMWTAADSRLRSDENAQFLVTREIFEDYRQYLQGKGENSTIEYTMDGFPALKWNGVNVVNMETVWDLFGRTYFEQDSTNNAYDIPNRALLTVPSNLPIATLNESDMTEVKSWYNIDERLMKTAYGYTLDAKLLEEYMIVAAY